MCRKHLFLLMALLAFCSCSRHYYAPAMYSNDISYQPKPASFDSAKTAIYVSGGLGFHTGISDVNTVSFGELNLSAAHVFNGFNLAYGAYGFAGTVDNSNYDYEKNDPNRFQSKGFAGMGGRFSANLFTHKDNYDFRYLGFEASYSKEFGDYAAFRRTVYGLDGYNTTTQTELVTIGATSEIIWHKTLAPDHQYVFRLFIGKTLGNEDYLKTSDYYKTFYVIPVYMTVSYFMQVRHIFFVGELNRNLSPVTGMRVKAGYRF